MIDEHAGREGIMAEIAADQAAHEAQQAAADEFGQAIRQAHNYGAGDVRQFMEQHGVHKPQAHPHGEHPADELNERGLTRMRDRKRGEFAAYSKGLRTAIVAAANQGYITQAERDRGFEALSLDPLKTVTQVTIGRITFTLDGEADTTEIQAKLATGLSGLLDVEGTFDVQVTARTVTE